MGNGQTYKPQYQFIQPRKINDHQKEARGDISDQIQHIFGISNIPVSHRPLATQSLQLKASIFKQLPLFERQPPIDQQYQDRITHLQQQLLYLKSIIEQSNPRSRRQSPIPSESSQAEEDTNSIHQSRSRVNLTYFESRQYVRQ